MRKKEKKNGLGKVILGMGIAVAAKIAYDKIPIVQKSCNNVADKIITGCKKLGKKMTECGAAKNTETAPAPATNQAN